MPDMYGDAALYDEAGGGSEFLHLCYENPW